MKTRILFTGLFALLSAAGCGDDPGATAGVPGAKPGADAGPNLPDGGSQADGSVSCTPQATDDPDSEGLDENCDGADGVIGVDAYVDPSAGSDTNLGTPSAPLRSLKSAISLATSRGGSVLLGKGQLTLDTLDASGSYVIYGGYSSTFLGARKRESSILAPTKAQGLSITSASSVTLVSLSVIGTNADDQVVTAHALRTSVDQLNLVDVEVRAGNGTPGAALGAAGAAGEPGIHATGAFGGVLKCKGAAQPSVANGAAVGKMNAQGGSPGNCATKTPAQSGAAGQAGTHGAHASKLPSIKDGMVQWPSGSAAPDNAGPGYGGAGGATCTALGSGGGAGSGGCSGGPGAGAGSGGGSAAVVVLAGKLVLTRSSLRTGFGGNGGSGAAGGEGGPGGLGAKPTCDIGMDCKKVEAECQPASDPYKLNCAGWGGTGGPGGKGGYGGAGAGGWSIGVVTTGPASVDLDAETTFELGAPGNGGDGATTRAPDGEKHKTWAVP